MTRTWFATALLAGLALSTTLQGQSLALTNADIAHLVVMRVSDQTVIAVINDTPVKQFDLSASAVSELILKGVSIAVVAAMRQSPLPVSTARPQTLAEASANATNLTHTWELSTNMVSSSQTMVPVLTASTPEGTKSEARTTTTSVVKDESWWRSHAVALRRTLAADITSLAAAQIHYNGLPDQARGILGTPIVDAWMKARADISAKSAIVANDQRALANFEEDARVGGVIPGWLREF